MTVKVINIKSIKVVTGSVLNKINVGDTLDTSKIQVVVEYDDGFSDFVSAEYLTVGAIDTATYGKKDLAVTYKGVTIKYVIEVVGEVSITVNDGYDKSVKVFDDYDESKITAYVTYSDDTKKTLAATDFTVGTIDTSVAGVKDLKVSYNGLETTLKITVVGVDTLTVVTDSVKNETLKGTPLDTSNIRVQVKYIDGSTEVVDASKLTLGKIDETKAGEQTLSITYRDKTVGYTVKVCTVTSIRIDGISSTVQSGKNIDVSGMKVYGVYNDTNNTSIELKDGTVTTNVNDLNANRNTTEVRKLTVTYNGEYGELTTEYEIYATAPELVGIEIRNYNSEVLLNAAYDNSSVVVYALYGNETSEKVTNFTMTSVATDKAGEVDLTVTYNGKTATKKVKVCAMTALQIEGLPLYVPSGEEIDISGMKVYGVYDNTAKTKVELTDGTVITNINELNTTHINSTDPRILTVKYVGMYGELEGTCTVDTVAPLLEKIEIRSYKTEVLLGGAHGKSDVTVYAVYGNGREDVLSADKFSITPVDTSVAGTPTFTVSFTENNITKTASAQVKVCTITSLRIEGVADEVQSGKTIDISKMKVYGVYNDSGETEVLLTEGYTTNIDKLNAEPNGTANRVLEVSYENGATGTFTVRVTAPELVGIEITGWDKTIGLGGVYNKNSVQVNGIYGNGTKAPITGFTVGDVVTSGVGDTTLTVTYNGMTATKTVNVLAISKLEVSGIANKVDLGGVLNTAGVTVTVTFTDGSTRIVTKADGVEVSAPDTSSAGNKELTVKYLGAEQKYGYHVKGVKSIAIFDGVANTLREGYAVDYSKLWLEITYTDESKEQVKASELSGVTYSGTGVGSTEFTVNYSGCTASKTLTKISLVSISALNSTVPATVLQGSDFSYADIKITAVYDNGEIYLVNDANVKFNPEAFDTATAGAKGINIEYFGKTTSVNILVKGVSEVTIVDGSVLKNIKVGQTLDTTNILVRVLYTDGTYFYADVNSTFLTVGEIDTSTEGNKDLYVWYQGVNSKPMTINVISSVSDVDGFIFGVLLHDELVARESYKNNFKDDTGAYRVGNDNPYYFYLNIITLDGDDNLVDVDGKNYPTAVTVYLVEGNTETKLEGDNLTKYVKLNPDGKNNAYQFTDAALNKTFRLEIRPADSTKYVNEADVTRSQTVTVVDGYNIYEAWELNIMTNMSTDITRECWGKEGKRDQLTLVTEFLKGNGVTRPANLNGIVLHGNFELKQSDFPAGYFENYKDANGKSVSGMFDHMGLYNIGLSQAAPTFNIYGNYYSIYSHNLPCVASKGQLNNKDDYSTSSLIRCTLVNYNGIDSANPRFDAYKINIQDIATRDNDPNSNDQSASERHMRGLSCYYFEENVATLTNVNVDAFMTSLNIALGNTEVNLNKVKFYNAWQTHVFIWNDNDYQEEIGKKNEATLDGLFGVKLNANDSFLAKCGGPVIIAQTVDTDLACNQSTAVDVKLDEKSEIYSYVTGQEAWFVATNQTPLAANIKTMIRPFTVARKPGFISSDKIKGVETVNIIMINMGTTDSMGSANDGYNGSFVHGDTVGLKMSNSKHKLGNSNPYKNAILDAFIAGTGGAPVFQDSNGAVAQNGSGTVFYNPLESALLDYYLVPTGVESDPYALAGSEFFESDAKYLSLYYQGMGMVMEYYH